MGKRGEGVENPEGIFSGNEDCAGFKSIVGGFGGEVKACGVRDGDGVGFVGGGNGGVGWADAVVGSLGDLYFGDEAGGGVIGFVFAAFRVEFPGVDVLGVV